MKAVRISIKDWGLNFGYGLFETFRIYEGIPFLVNEHLSRLAHSFLELSFPGRLETGKLSQAVHEHIRRKKFESGAVRLSITFGNETEGIDPGIFFTDRRIPYTPHDYDTGFSARITPFRKNEYSPVVNHKTFNQLENILVLKRYEPENIKECIFLNSANYLAEGSKSNLFFCRRGTVFTPSRECGILPGITRQKVIELLKGKGIEVREGKYPTADLLRADESFFTNSLMEVMPLVRIDDNPVGTGRPGELSRWLRELYHENVKEYVLHAKNGRHEF